MNWLEDKARIGGFPQFWFSGEFIAFFGFKNKQGGGLFLLKHRETCPALVSMVDLQTLQAVATMTYYLRPSLNTPGQLLETCGAGWVSRLFGDEEHKLDAKRCPLPSSHSLIKNPTNAVIIVAVC